jgi:hypothetical protein
MRATGPESHLPIFGNWTPIVAIKNKASSAAFQGIGVPIERAKTENKQLQKRR